MNKLSYHIPRLSLSGKDVFLEASKEELRVLLALIELGGEALNEQQLADAAGTSRARCISALALWEEAGIIVKSPYPCEKKPSVTEEFENSFNEADIEEKTSAEVAKSIRDEGLAEALEECARLMDKSALSTEEIKNICVLSSEYALSPEYIITLAAHICSKGKLTAVRLRDEAKRLVKRDVDTVEALERYVNDRESESAAEWEFRRVIGIYNRSLSTSEKKLFRKWSEELGYSAAIVECAYDACISATGKFSPSYMDKLLTGWHEAGCKTVAECESQNAAHKNASAFAEQKAAKRQSKSEAPKPRYGDFDINEAFKHALSRSFSDEE